MVGRRRRGDVLCSGSGSGDAETLAVGAIRGDWFRWQRRRRRAPRWGRWPRSRRPFGHRFLDEEHICSQLYQEEWHVRRACSAIIGGWDTEEQLHDEGQRQSVHGQIRHSECEALTDDRNCVALLIALASCDDFASDNSGNARGTSRSRPVRWCVCADRRSSTRNSRCATRPRRRVCSRACTSRSL